MDLSDQQKPADEADDVEVLSSAMRATRGIGGPMAEMQFGQPGIDADDPGK